MKNLRNSKGHVPKPPRRRVPDMQESASPLVETLRLRRVDLNISQDYLGYLTGMQHQRVSALERMRFNPTLATLERVAKALGGSLRFVPDDAPRAAAAPARAMPAVALPCRVTYRSPDLDYLTLTRVTPRGILALLREAQLRRVA